MVRWFSDEMLCGAGLNILVAQVRKEVTTGLIKNEKKVKFTILYLGR